ncbi:TPA: hypothetical protein ACT92K_001878, partial [Enterobacter roggenkampii]
RLKQHLFPATGAAIIRNESYCKLPLFALSKPNVTSIPLPQRYQPQNLVAIQTRQTVKLIRFPPL